MNRRVVITGYGIVNALGTNGAEVEKRLFEGQCGLVKKRFESKSGTISGTVGEVDLHEEDPFFTENDIPSDKCLMLEMHAADECIRRSGITGADHDPKRCGVAVGTSLGGMLSGQAFHRQWRNGTYEEADGRLLKAYPLHVTADVLSRRYGFYGIRAVISTACAASGNIIGYAADMIRTGKYDVMLAGGVDPLSTFSFAGFHSLKALDPDFCRPYSESHGINLGEGGAFLLLESLEHARARGAEILAEFYGYGLSADAYHPTAPDLGGGGASRAMNEVIRLGQVDKKEIRYVNGHGTGTVANDHAERMALKKTFGEETEHVAMSSIKGAIDHCLGAAGAEEAVSVVMSLRNGMIPPTVHFDRKPDPSDPDFVPNRAEKRACDVILSDSFAFGGNNCCILIGKKRPDTFTSGRPDADEKIVVTGAGVCGTGGADKASLWETFRNRKVWLKRTDPYGIPDCVSGVMPETDWKKSIPGKMLRRIDLAAKLAMTAGREALNEAKIRVTRSNAERIGVIYGTGTGPMGTIVEIDRTIIEKGMGAVSLSEFPNSVINAAPGNFCIANMLKGPTSTLSMGTASMLLALTYAVEVIRNDMADMIVVLGADEISDDMLAGMDKLGLVSRRTFYPMGENQDGWAVSAGAVAMVLETEKHALERKAEIAATVEGYAALSEDAPFCSVKPDGVMLSECVGKALKDAGCMSPDLYIPSAMGIRCADSADEHAIGLLEARGILEKGRCRYSVSTPLVGVAMGCLPGYNLLNALYSFEKGEVIGLPEKDYPIRESLREKFAAGENAQADIRTACVSSLALGGDAISVVLRKYGHEV